jgi:hypothetical protein
MIWIETVENLSTISYSQEFRTREIKIYEFGRRSKPPITYIKFSLRGVSPFVKRTPTGGPPEVDRIRQVAIPADQLRPFLWGTGQPVGCTDQVTGFREAVG